MLFIHPMWDHESQRIGKQKCTPAGYALHGIADLLGFVGLILFLGLGAYLAFKRVAGGFRASLLWLLAIPFGVGLVSDVLYHYSWVLARRRGFTYDYDTSVASWDEDGKRITYKWEPNQASRRTGDPGGSTFGEG
jgi:hypothetical protein